MKKERVDIVLDLQYGSTGKGLLVGFLAKRVAYDTVITTWAPNAGHTFIDRSGRRFVHTQLALGLVSPLCQHVLLGPGSVIDPPKLLAEIQQCRDIIDAKNIRICIHPNAAVVLERHREEESKSPGAIGSTRKGVGAAIIERIRRDVQDPNVASMCSDLWSMVVPKEEYMRIVNDSSSVLVEGAQGYGLSLYHGFYPYVTSRDVSTAQILADSGVPFEKVLRARASDAFDIYGTARTYPIRVANRYDESGQRTEFSGPCYEDQEEISFEDIAQPQEFTTVTQLPRRIFTFSVKQIREAIAYNGVNKVFLNFVNYVRSNSELVRIASAIQTGTCAKIHSVGVGPTEDDVLVIDDMTFSHLDNTQRTLMVVDTWEKYCAKV